MDDKYLMENIMFGSKVINDLYMHGFIEAANERVFTTFCKAIQDTAKMHYEIFKGMETAGFYNMTNVDQNKIKQTKEKLECTCEKCDCEEDK